MPQIIEGLKAHVGADISEYRRAMREVNSVAGRTSRGISQIGRSLGLVFSAYGAMRAVKGAISSAAKFQTGMAEVSTLLDTSKINMRGLSKETLELATRIGVAPNGLTKALYQAVSAGIPAGEALQFVGESAKAGIAGLSDTFTAVDLLTSILNSYGDTAKNVARYSDILFETIRLGKTTFPELAGTIGRVAPIAAQMKIPFEEVGAAIATMTKRGLSTDLAVTGLRQTLVSILNPSKQAQEMAGKLGIQFNAAAVASKGLSRFMQEIMQATRGLPEPLTKLFGNVRALTGVLSGFTGTEFAKQLGEIKAGAGATESALGKMNETVGRKFEAAKARFQVAAIELGNRTLPWLAKKIEEVVTAMDALGGKPIRTGEGTSLYETYRREYERGLLHFALPEMLAGKGRGERRQIRGNVDMFAALRGPMHEKLLGMVPSGVEQLYRKSAGALPWGQMQLLSGAAPEVAERQKTEFGKRMGVPKESWPYLQQLWQRYSAAGVLPKLGTPTWPSKMSMQQPYGWRGEPRVLSAAQDVKENVTEMGETLADTLRNISNAVKGIVRDLNILKKDLRTQNAS